MMIPLHNIQKTKYLVIQFQSCKDIIMIENYCSDPDCFCNEVLLNFMQLNEDRKVQNSILNLKVNIKNGKILEKKVLDSNKNSDEIIKEFSQHFYQFKRHLNENNKKVKKYFSEYHADHLPPSVLKLVKENNCVSYREIFGTNNIINFNYLDEDFIIEDQYCLNPTCECNEIII